MIAQSFKAFFCSLISGFSPLFRVWWQTPLHRQLPPPHRTPVGSSLYLWRTQEITPQPTLTSRLSKCDDCKSVIFFHMVLYSWCILTGKLTVSGKMNSISYKGLQYNSQIMPRFFCFGHRCMATFVCKILLLAFYLFPGVYLVFLPPR